MVLKTLPWNPARTGILPALVGFDVQAAIWLDLKRT